MEVISNKRPAESARSDQVESYAVCSSCNRLSTDLKICHHCNSPLSEEDSSHCYSAEPKRARLEPTNVDANLTESDTSIVRPETLFVNVNNQAVPVLVRNPPGPQPLVFAGQSTTTQPYVVSNAALVTSQTNVRPRSVVGIVNSSSTRTPSTVINVDQLSNGNNFSPHPMAATSILTTRPSSDTISTFHTPLGGYFAGPARVAVSYSDSMTLRPISTQITLPTYNLQPPPPPFSSNIARLPVAVTNASVGSNMVAGAAPTQNISVSAIQIRIGSKKFKPVSPVTFKDDGILFTLKDYTYAPVLLNARAIVKCKANLNTFSYPVLFLFLENSCMRQIRQIFGLTTNEFAPTSEVELKRCISIFPIFGVEGKQHVQQLTFSIKRSFEAMVKRYPRSSAILEEITNDAVINILLEAVDGPEMGNDATGGGGGTAAAAISSASPSTLSQSNASSALHAIAVTSDRMSSSVSQMPIVAMSSSVQTNGMTTSAAADRGAQTTGAFAANCIANRVIAQGTAVTTTNYPATSAPVLVIPSDTSRWQTIQKTLVVGGVYHVLTPNKQRKYCLWNGTQLVPCLVQNTEVTLNCSRIRIGCLSLQCVGQVRIKADGASGIYFTVKSEKTGLQEVSLASGDMLSLQLCISRISVIFITLSWMGGEKLNTKLKQIGCKENVFEANSREMMKKHILIFLTDLNNDQEEALRQMKFPNNPTLSPSSIEVIEHAKGLHILTGIRNHCLGLGSAAITEYVKTNSLTGVSGFDRVAVDLAESSNAEPNANDDDDDDDVIMTQEEVGIKCPYTQKEMVEPVKNIICGHNYEKGAILEFIARKKGNAKCPYAGCGNTIALQMADLVDNTSLKEYISGVKRLPVNCENR